MKACTRGRDHLLNSHLNTEMEMNGDLGEFNVAWSLVPWLVFFINC